MLITFSNFETTSSEWHHRLGHHVFPILKHIISSCNLELSYFEFSNFIFYICQCNKSHKLSFSTFSLTSSQPLEIIFSNI